MLKSRHSLAAAVRRPLAFLRIDASPHGLALGLSLGIFMATTPFLGLQVCGAMGLAWLFGGNVPAAVIGTFWANPVTCPLLWMASYQLGAALLQIDDAINFAGLSDGINAIVAAMMTPGASMVAVAYQLLWPVAKPLTLGAVLIGTLSAIVFYCLARQAIVLLRTGRMGAVRLRLT